jgi:hypothetical protein
VDINLLCLQLCLTKSLMGAPGGSDRKALSPRGTDPSLSGSYTTEGQAACLLSSRVSICLAGPSKDCLAES